MLINILFVDDEPNVLSAHKRSFRAYADRWSLRFAASGEEALEAIRKDPVDILVSDLAMPKMQGLELVAEVKKAHPDTTCIILTGTGDMQSALNAINEVDVFRYYLKPCPSEELARGICDAIEARNDVGSNANLLDIGKTTLDRLPYGVFVVSADARVLFMNFFANELVEASDGLTIGRDQLLRTDRPPETQLLHAAIKNASEADDLLASSGALFVEREDAIRPLHCLVQRFVGTDSVDKQDPYAAIFVTDPERAPQISPSILSGLFDLTPSESRLLACLVACGRLEQAASDANLSLSTARTYLKQIFSKTGTGRQGELIQLVLLSPALIKSAA